MILLEDTRQTTSHGSHDRKYKYFESAGIEVRRTKLYVGDYTLPTNQSICVDTKKDIQELGQAETELLVGAALGSIHKNQAGSSAALGNGQIIIILAELLPIGSGVDGKTAVTAVDTQGDIEVITQLCAKLGRDEKTVLLIQLCRVFTDQSAHLHSILLHLTTLLLPITTV